MYSILFAAFDTFGATERPVMMTSVVLVVENCVVDSAFVITTPAVRAANVPSPRRNVVVLFGGVGTWPATVAVITGVI